MNRILGIDGVGTATVRKDAPLRGLGLCPRKQYMM
jgi:hypothetical protein